MYGFAFKKATYNEGMLSALKNHGVTAKHTSELENKFESQLFFHELSCHSFSRILSLKNENKPYFWVLEINYKISRNLQDYEALLIEKKRSKGNEFFYMKNV